MALGLFDAHLHTSCRTQEDLHNLSYFGVTHLFTSAYFSTGPKTLRELRDRWVDFLRYEPVRLAAADIHAFLGLGLTVRNFPGRGYAEVLGLLETHLSRGDLAAVGPIGVLGDNANEWDLFRSQLRLANEFKVPVVISPPDDLRVTMTYKMLDVVVSERIENASVMILDVNRTTLEAVLASGVHAGLRVIGDFEGALALAKSSEVERIAVATNAGEGPVDVLALAKLERELEPGAQTRDVLFNNAYAFFTRSDR